MFSDILRVPCVFIYECLMYNFKNNIVLFFLMKIGQLKMLFYGYYRLYFYEYIFNILGEEVLQTLRRVEFLKLIFINTNKKRSNKT